MHLLAAEAGMLQAVWGFVQQYPHEVIFSMLVLCGVGLPIPEEPILLMAGAMAVELSEGEAHGMSVQLMTMTVICSIGILLGDLACFHIGRTLGQGIFRFRWVSRLATRARRVRAERFFQKYGPWAIFLARFFAGVRLVMYFSAGMSRRVSYLRFLFMDFLGTIVSVPISVWFGYVAWKELRDWSAAKEKLGPFHAILMAAIAIGVIVWWLIVRYRRRQEKARTLARYTASAARAKDAAADPGSLPGAGEAAAR